MLHQKQSGALERQEYQDIVAKLDAIPSMACPNFCLLRQQHPRVPLQTFLALFSQEAQYRVIKTHHMHKTNMATYCSRYRRGTDVLDLCASADFPPCLMMRRMLEHMLGLSKQRVSDVLKDPDLLTVDITSGAETDTSEDLMARLRLDIVRCARADRNYSPFSDMAKALAGLEHEAALYAALKQAGVAHWNEQDLRDKGMYKTPDALLQVPIAVRCPFNDRWHIVHWIDSKASFGDDRLHAQALEGQYRTYLNRYGSGAVIYWMGMIKDLAEAQGADRGCDAGEVLLLEHFPDPADMYMLMPAEGTS